MLDKNSKKSLLIKDTIIFAIGSIGSKMILFIMVPLYTNFLTTEEYGTADLLFTFAQLLIPIITVSIYQAVLRFGLSNNSNKSSVILSGLVVTLSGSVVIIILTPLIGIYSVINEWKWYLCVYIILNSINLTLLNYLKVLNKNKEYAFISTIQTLVLAIFNVLLIAGFQYGVKGYLIANIVACIITFFITIFTSKVWNSIKNAKLEKKLIKEMLGYSIPIILNDISWWVIHSSDKILIQLMISSSALGVYTVATKIPSLINVTISIFSQAWNISSVREIESSNDNSFYEDVFEAYSFVTFMSSLAILLFIKPFMLIYVGDAFSDSWRFVPLLIAGASFSAISSYFGGLYVALKKTINSMITTLIAAGINLGVTYFCIMKFGIIGAAIGTLTSYIIITVIRMLDITRYIKIRIRYMNYSMNALLVLILACWITKNDSSVILKLIVIGMFIINNRKIMRKIIWKIRR